MLDALIEIIGRLYGKEINTAVEMYMNGFTPEEVRAEIANQRELAKRAKKAKALTKVKSF